LLFFKGGLKLGVKKTFGAVSDSNPQRTFSTFEDITRKR